MSEKNASWFFGAINILLEPYSISTRSKDIANELRLADDGRTAVIVK